MGHTLLGTTTISSNVASVAINGIIDDTYDLYEIHITNVRFTTLGSSLMIEFSDSSTDYNLTMTNTAYYSAHYKTGSWYAITGTAGWAANSTHNTSTADNAQDNLGAMLTDAIGAYDHSTQQYNSHNGIIRLYDPSNTTFHKKFEAEFESGNYQIGAFYVKTAGSINTTSAVEKVRFSNNVHTEYTSPLMQAGIFRLYGVT
jgi:hypothetical protein